MAGKYLIEKVIRPANLDLASLAAATGEYTAVIERIVDGVWRMPDRVAERMVMLRPQFLSTFKVVVPETAQAWIKMGPTRGEPTRDEAFYNLTHASDVKDNEGISSNIDLFVWARKHRAFTLNAVIKAFGLDPNKLQKAAELLESIGYYSRRENVGGGERIYVYRWNPFKFEQPKGRPPIYFPTSLESPGQPLKTIEEKEIDSLPFDTLLNLIRPQFLTWVTADKDNITLPKLLSYAAKINVWFISRSKMEQLVKYLLVEQQYEFSKKAKRYIKYT